MLARISEELATVNGVDIYYKVVGDGGEPLLMIMGLSFSHLDWGDALISQLAEHYRVILFDNRDSGRSSQSSEPYVMSELAEDSAGLLEALDIPKAHIFGVSMGGMIAQHLALTYAAKVDKLILGCTAADMEGLGNISPELLANSMGDLLFTPEYVSDHAAEIAAFLDEVTPFHSEPVALLRQLYALGSHDTRSQLSDITAETLAIVGERDIVIPVAKSEELVEGIPNAELSVIPDAAHGFTYSHADETFNRIHSFLQ